MQKVKSLLYALLAAAFYAISVPMSKLLLHHIAPTTMAALLYLGAAKTSACYAVAPFIGAFLSFLIFKESLQQTYLIALAVMLAGAALVAADTLRQNHTHHHQHTFTHVHDGSTHTHIVTHAHEHSHYRAKGAHSHYHTKAELEKELISHI